MAASTSDIATTLTEVVTGLLAGATLGVLAGLLLGRAPIAAGILRPIVVAFYSVPLVALAPLFIMFFGLDMLPKIVLVTTRRVLPAVLQHLCRRIVGGPGPDRAG